MRKTYYIPLFIALALIVSYLDYRIAKADIFGSSLQIWYTMNSNNTLINITDSSGNSNNGSYVHTHATTTVAAIMGQGLTCNPGGDTGDYVNTNYTTTLHTITFSAWIYMKSTGGTGRGRIFDKLKSGSQSILFFFRWRRRKYRSRI